MTMTKPTSEQVTFTAAGSGAALRNLVDKVREVVSVKDFGAVGNGVADDTVAIQAAMTAAAGKRLYVPSGTYIVSTLNGVSDICVFGDGSGVSIIKRKAAGATNQFVSFASCTNVRVEGITFDGNKAAQTTGANSLQFFSCDNVEVTQCEFIDAIAVGGGYGSGLAFSNSTTAVNNTSMLVSGNRFSGNDGPALFVNKTYYVAIERNFFYGNGAGVNVINLVFPPVAGVQKYLTICGNTIRSCVGSGIGINGYYESGTSQANQRYGPNVPASEDLAIVGNVIEDCGGYGIAFQGSEGVVSCNTVSRCGTNVGGAGILMNCRRSTCNSNTISECNNFGIDAGGSSQITVANNLIYGTGALTGTAGTDINCGGDLISVTGNNVCQAGTHAMTGITVFGVEGDGTNPFPLPNGRVSYSTVDVSGNSVFGNSTASLGIYVSRNMSQVHVANNVVTKATLPYVLEVPELVESGNVDNSMYGVTGISMKPVASAATMVIPDVGERFLVTGTTGITSIQTYSSNTFSGRVRFVGALTHGSGYSQATPPTVTFAGGGGSGLACTAEVSLDGTVVTWQITNNGSGYTSPPTPTITHNGGSGATCNPQINCFNFTGREITLVFQSGLTVTSGSNLSLNGNYTASAGDVLRLVGLSGIWYEISRS